jgi:hypothetical protein
MSTTLDIEALASARQRHWRALGSYLPDEDFAEHRAEARKLTDLLDSAYRERSRNRPTIRLERRRVS